MAISSQAVTSSSILLGTTTIIITTCTPHPVQPREAAAHHVITTLFPDKDSRARKGRPLPSVTQ